MKVLILAGGYATRLWPVTKHRAKPLLPLGGKPILSYILDELEEVREVDGIYVTTNERFGESFEEYLSERDNERYDLVVEGQGEEEEKYGAIGGMMNVIGDRPKDDYLIIGGDNYYSFKIIDFLKFALRKGSVANACFKVKSFEEAENYGIVDFDDRRKIVSFEEKPDEPASRMASTACYFFPSDKLEAFDEYDEYWRGKLPREQYMDEPGRFIEWLVGRYDVYAYPFEGRWVDIGTRGGYLRAERDISGGNILVGEIQDSKIGDNVTVLEGSRVEDSEIENSIIFEGCKIEDSVIKDSLVGENTKIRNKDLREGIIQEMD